MLLLQEKSRFNWSSWHLDYFYEVGMQDNRYLLTQDSYFLLWNSMTGYFVSLAYGSVNDCVADDVSFLSLLLFIQCRNFISNMAMWWKDGDYSLLKSWSCFQKQTSLQVPRRQYERFSEVSLGLWILVIDMPAVFVVLMAVWYD